MNEAIYPGTHATGIFSKLDHGYRVNDPAFQPYLPYFRNFLSAQQAYPSATAPQAVAEEIYAAAIKKDGAIHVVSGGDARFQNRLKKWLPARLFQSVQRSLMEGRPSGGQVSFTKWLFGKRVAPVEVDLPAGVLE